MEIKRILAIFVTALLLAAAAPLINSTESTSEREILSGYEIVDSAGHDDEENRSRIPQEPPLVNWNS